MGLIEFSLVTAVFLWGVWDYRRHDRGSAIPYVKAIVGLVLILVILVRALLW